MQIAVVKGVVAQIVALAAESPDEVCGLLFGTEEGGDVHVSAIQPCANVAADPARRFEIDPVALITAYRAARGGGPRIVGHYHSHPSGDPVPSPRDAAAAVEDGVLWLIVAGERVRAWRTAAGGRVERRFDECEIVEPL